MIPDRMRSLISVLLIKVCLGDYYEIPPREIKIVRVTGKKPYFHFENNSKYKHIINFNVSHDNEVVVIAISKFIVGIDTMKLEFPRKNESNDIKEHTASKFFLNMKNVFSNCEWSYIGNDIGRFMEYWTIKESFVKCIGVGLYIEPSRLLVEKDYFLNDTYINKIFLDNVSQNCVIYSTDKVIDDFFISICISTPDILRTFDNNTYNKMYKHETCCDELRQMLTNLSNRSPPKIHFEQVKIKYLIQTSHIDSNPIQ